MKHTKRLTLCLLFAAAGCAGTASQSGLDLEPAPGNEPGTQYYPTMPAEIVRELEVFRRDWEIAANEADRRKMEAASQKLNAKAQQYYPALLNGMVDDNVQIRRVSCAILGFLRSPDKKPRVADRLLKVVANPDEHYLVKVAALYSLGHLQKTDTDLTAVSALMSNEMQAPMVRAAAAFCAGRLYPLVTDEDPQRSVFHALIGRLADPSPWVRENAVQALQNVRDNSSVPYLINYTLHDAVHRVRMLTVAALEQLGDDRAVDPLIELLRSDNQELALQSMRALERFGEDPRVSQAMIDQLSHRDLVVRGEAAYQLRYFKGMPGVTRALVRTAKNIAEHENVREKAIDSLGIHQNQSTIPDLIPLLDERIGVVQAATVKALRAVTGIRAVKDPYNARNWEKAVERMLPEVVFPADYEYHPEKQLNVVRRPGSTSASGARSVTNRRRTPTRTPPRTTRRTNSRTNQRSRFNSRNTGRRR